VDLPQSIPQCTPPSHLTSLTLTLDIRLSSLPPSLPFRQSILSSPILLSRLLAFDSVLLAVDVVGDETSLSLEPAVHLAEYVEVGE